MPVALPIALDMVLVLAALVLFVLLETAQLWLRPLINAVMHPHTALWKRVLSAPFRYVLGPAAKFALHYTTSFLAWNVHAIVRPTVRFIHSLAVLASELADLVEHFPAEVHWALHHLRHVVIPSLIHEALKPVRIIAADAKAIAVALQHDVDAITGAVADALNSIGWVTSLDFFGALRNLAHAFAHLWRYTYGELTSGVEVLKSEAIALGRDAEALADYVRRELARRLAAAEAAVAGLENVVYGELKAFIDALKEGIIPAAMLTAITAALALVWDGLFCRNTNTVGKHLCGLDSALLDGFLVGVTAELTLGGLDELIHELQAVVGETAAGIRALAEV